MKDKALFRFQTELDLRLKKAFLQVEKLEKAAEWVADCLSKDGWIYITGTGHSHILAEEIFYRAGGFARIRPIFHEALMLHQSASESTVIERKSALAAKILNDYPIQKNDLLILSSNSGRNSVILDFALEAQKLGAKVIAITNLTHSQQVTSRHSSGKKLYEVVDLYLDNCGDFGDACLEIEGIEMKVGATSTIIGSALLQAIMVQAADLMIKKNIKPELFSSSNTDEGEKHNHALISKYKSQIKGL